MVILTSVKACSSLRNESILELPHRWVSTEHSRSSNPGTFEVPGKGVEVTRKCGLQEPPCSIHVVDGHEKEATHHLEPLVDIRARNLVFWDQVGHDARCSVWIPGTYRLKMI